MLITRSASAQASFRSGLEYNPSVGYPFVSSVCKVCFCTTPGAFKPALAQANKSAASRNAIDYAIGLRQEFPMHTNNTLSFFEESFIRCKQQVNPTRCNPCQHNSSVISSPFLPCELRSRP